MRFIKTDSGPRSAIWLLLSVKLVRLAAFSSPDRSTIPLFEAVSLVKFAKSSDGIAASTAKRNALRSAAANAASGKSTEAGTVTPCISVPPCSSPKSTAGFLTGLFPKFKNVRFVKLDSGLTSLISLSARCNFVRFVNPDSRETSLISLSLRSNSVRFVRPDSGERSLIELLLSNNCVNPVACSSPVRSVMLGPKVPEIVSVARVAGKIG